MFQWLRATTCKAYITLQQSDIHSGFSNYVCQSQRCVTGQWWLNNFQTFWTSSTTTKLIPPTQLQSRKCSQYHPVESIWGRVERDFHLLFTKTRYFKCLLLCLWHRNIFGPICCKTIELLTPFLFNALLKLQWPEYGCTLLPKSWWCSIYGVLCE